MMKSMGASPKKGDSKKPAAGGGFSMGGAMGGMGGGMAAMKEQAEKLIN